MAASFLTSRYNRVHRPLELVAISVHERTVVGKIPNRMSTHYEEAADA